MSVVTIREKTIDEKISDIELKYKDRLEAKEKLVLKAMASDGSDQTEKVIIYQNEYNQLANQQDTEILEILGGV